MKTKTPVSIQTFLQNMFVRRGETLAEPQVQRLAVNKSKPIKIPVSDLYADLLAAVNAGNIALAQSLANGISAGMI